MLIEVIKDATLEIKAGQTVEVTPEQAARAISLGFAVEIKKSVPKKTAKK